MMSIPAADRLVQKTDNYPGPLESAKDALRALADFLKEHPAILNEADAKLGANFVKSTRIALSAARDARDNEIAPLSKQVADVRALYEIVREKTPKNHGGQLERAFNVLRQRMTDYGNALEAARIAEVERLQREAEEKERLAREAEAQEKNAIASAEVGECTDIGAAIEYADAAFTDFKRANHQLAVAKRDVPMRIASDLGGPVVAMRNRRVLVVTDPIAAIKALWPNERIGEAIRLAANAHEEEFDELPPGITATTERSI